MLNVSMHAMYLIVCNFLWKSTKSSILLLLMPIISTNEEVLIDKKKLEIKNKNVFIQQKTI